MFYFWMSVLMVCSGFALYGEGLGTDSWRINGLAG
ncbi:Ni/Fe-hydrogenase 1 b-type cytochrome subunit [Salmonella enterica subsp. arizonae]|uniref:Ni/Fe-hydrogenase 1 b-type cytochrome subunit n=1 Tax=Salmonella enterica subsp. arizonae TaxID=59203 RepID=A0A379S719_SALER|nr:Ni/Fe-hydrogenase 1 b-type cytochrome subunit [Salmonella enterica subsp. arizonae]